MATKTKAELEQEIENGRNQISSLKAELEKAYRVENKTNAATELYEMYEAFITAGFTDEQAWELTKIAVCNTTANCKLR